MTGRIEKFFGPRGPKIIGASEVTPGEPKVMDSHTPQEPTEIETRVHGEVITEANKIRTRVIQPGEPEIRVRQQPTQQEWDRVKRLEDE